MMEGSTQLAIMLKTFWTFELLTLVLTFFADGIQHSTSLKFSPGRPYRNSFHGNKDAEPQGRRL
jgi:hypothetical protein